jgi:hypothetical protein
LWWLPYILETSLYVILGPVLVPTIICLWFLLHYSSGCQKSEQKGQHCTARHVPASCSPSAPPDHLVIWRGPLVYAPWCQKLAWTVRGGEEVFLCFGCLFICCGILFFLPIFRCGLVQFFTNFSAIRSSLNCIGALFPSVYSCRFLSAYYRM